MKIIAVTNQKGGVSKTTSTLNIAAGLTRKGRRVLAVDLDPQAHLTDSLGIELGESTPTILEVLKGEATLQQAVIEKENFHIIPSTLELSGAEKFFSGTPGNEHLLKEALESVTGYDYILFDCPPSIGLLTFNALTAAREVYIPLQAEFLSMNGISALMQTIQAIQKRLNKDLKVTGVIASRVDVRKKHNQDVIGDLAKYFPNALFKSVIRENIALAEAPSFGQSIFAYKASSNGAKDYAALCDEILARG